MRLYYAEEYDWAAEITVYQPKSHITYQMTIADEDWRRTNISFDISPVEGGCEVSFRHEGWKEANKHFRVSNYCWVMYLLCLKNYCEEGVVLPYEDRGGS